jgi:hypothetical protein
VDCKELATIQINISNEEHGLVQNRDGFRILFKKGLVS